MTYTETCMVDTPKNPKKNVWLRGEVFTKDALFI